MLFVIIGIGYKGQIPWYIKEDLRFFSKSTKGNGNNAVIMGKNTYNSIGKVLPHRDNIILSTTLDYKDIDSKHDNLFIFSNINDSIDFCNKKKYDNVWIIGGESIYSSFLKLDIVRECVITKINMQYDCDTFFPFLDDNWSHTKTELLHNSKELDINIYYYKKYSY